MSLRLRPWTVKRERALAFNADVHRRRKRVQGAMWCVSVRSGNEIVGIALVGWPAMEWTDDEIDTLCVLRCTVTRTPARSSTAPAGAQLGPWGCDSMVTYTDLDEPGTSLRAAGWIEDGRTDGGEWDRPSRPRRKAVNAEPKRRWWAPGSKRAPKKGTA